MNPLYNLLAFALFSAFASGLVTRFIPAFRTLFSIILLGGIGYLAHHSAGQAFIISTNQWDIILEMTDFSKFFVRLIIMFGLLFVLYSHEFTKRDERGPYYNFLFFLTLGAMLGVSISQDWLSFFLFWEIMTWASFLIVLLHRKLSHSAAIKYFVFSASGAYAMLTAILMLYAETSSFSHAASFAVFPQLAHGQQSLIIFLFLAGFAVKSALMPLHVWAPDAYTLAPNQFTGYFSAVLSKMGILGMAIVLFKFANVAGHGDIIRQILAWLGGFTALFASLYAVFQNDAKKLLAYSSVAQLGYIISGLAIGTPMAVSAALYLTVLHAIFKGSLFMAVGAVEYQTGSRDMNVVTGLIRKMPLTFFTVLIGIIMVSGVPPLGGFTGKWLLYESMISSHNEFLAILLFAASTAGFLYLYRIIFSLFLGQEEPEFENIKEAPFTMWVPMILLALISIVIGYFPGASLSLLKPAIAWLGISMPAFEASVLSNPWGNHLNMFTVFSSIGTIFMTALVLITWKSYKTTRYVTTKDIHTSGEIPTENENLTYAVDFYKPFERALGNTLGHRIDKFYNKLASTLEDAFDILRYIYTGNGQTYALYVVIFLVMMLLFSSLILGVKI